MTSHLPAGLLAALALLGLPQAGAARETSRPATSERAAPPPPGPAAPSAARPAPPPPDGSSPSARPPPPPPGGPGQPRPPPAGHPPGYVVPPPYWYGWGWGWGYAPIWGYGWWGSPTPPPGAMGPPAPTPPADRLVSTLRATYMDGEGSGGSLAFASEGRQAGWRFSVDALTPDRIDGVLRTPGTEAMAYGVAAVSWSLASAETHRLRVEAGGSMLSVPSSGSYMGTRYAGTTAFGLLLGLSGQVGLVGPLGLEAHVRATPYPVPIVDTGVALALRTGPLAFTGGWRWLDVSGTSGNGPATYLSAPELGVALVF